MTPPGRAGARSTYTSVVPVAPPGRIRGWADRAFATATEQNLDNIETLLATMPPGGVLLDLGCDDGTSTLEFAAAARAGSVHGLELVEERAQLARERGIDVRIGDLNARFPYDDGTFDLVVSNMVLEHVHDTDNFVREARRVLKPRGHAVVSTENLASWHNMFSLMLGWQPFSLTNVSHEHMGLGNPLAVHRGQSVPLESWEHVRVFAYRGLRELFEAHGFVLEELVGAGYYPLPALLGRLDPRHAAFLTVKALRPELG